MRISTGDVAFVEKRRNLQALKNPNRPLTWTSSPMSLQPRDVLLFGLSQTPTFGALVEWYSESNVHEFVPDYHRLQLEHWLWTRREWLSKGKVIDVGQSYGPRRWLGNGYQTLGLYDSDITADLLDLPMDENTVDALIATEVLEHCKDPFKAMKEILRVLKPQGLFLGSTPFIWPEHGTSDYKDYWRFTKDGWLLLLEGFTDIKITPTAWTDEGSELYDLLRRFECMGLKQSTSATTGYLIEAVKP